MINITPICKKFYKKPASFLDNDNIDQRIPKHEKNVTRGPKGFTEIHEKHLQEFFLWLAPITRTMVLNGKSLQSILDFCTHYKLDSTPKEAVIRHYKRKGV